MVGGYLFISTKNKIFEIWCEFNFIFHWKSITYKSKSYIWIKIWQHYFIKKSLNEEFYQQTILLDCVSIEVSPLMVLHHDNMGWARLLYKGCFIFHFLKCHWYKRRAHIQRYYEVDKGLNRGHFIFDFFFKSPKFLSSLNLQTIYIIIWPT
jgi:hypothetical protein